MLTILPLVGSLFVEGRKREKVLVALSAPLALNVLLLCNSRGAFLGLIGAGLTFLVLARGATRKTALSALLIGSVGLYFLLGDEDIFNRFMTTFVGSEERDGSAASRITFWRAGLLMLSDYPLGAGGGAFKFVLGGRYLSQVLGSDAEDRALHNGYLTEATDWGLQGLFLKLLLWGVAIAMAHRASVQCRLRGDNEGALTGICIVVAAAALLIACLFGSFLQNEWAYWVVALLVKYAELYRGDATATAASPDVNVRPAA
jgi:O-antigen ligase